MYVIILYSINFHLIIIIKKNIDIQKMKIKKNVIAKKYIEIAQLTTQILVRFNNF